MLRRAADSAFWLGRYVERAESTARMVDVHYRSRLETSVGDPRIGWSATDTTPAPALHHRRDGILPTVAAALSVRGATLTGTAARAEEPPALHPLVQDFLDTLTSDQRDRFTGRCAETILISRHITAADAQRSKRAARKPMTNGEARKTLKQAKLTTRRSSAIAAHSCWPWSSPAWRPPLPSRSSCRAGSRCGRGNRRCRAGRCR